MPTGYTHAVAEGKVITLTQFALVCARAFGAAIHMRDDPLDQPLRPDHASSYHRDAAAAARRRLDHLLSLSPIAAQTECQAWNHAQVRHWKSYHDDRGVRAARYRALRTAVLAWSEPTPEHRRLKDFMLEQLEQSLERDCDERLFEPYVPYPLTVRWPDWLASEIARAQRDIKYHDGNLDKEVERVSERNAWVRTLQASLAA